MIFSYSLLIALSLLISVYTGQASNFIIPILFFSIGVGLIQFFADPKNQKEYTKLYSIAYLVYMFYAELCFFYMKEHNYSCLLVSDTITAYIPWVEDFMQEKSLRSMLELLFGNDWTPYKHAGIILLYWTAVGKFSTLFGYELYFNLQVSVFFLSAFVPVFMCRFLMQNDIKKSYRLSLIYSLCSVFGYYATLILRDAPIALFYMISFSYLLLSNNSLKKHLVFVSMITLTYLIRPQNGFFLLLFYFISYFSNENRGSRTSFILLFVVGTIISYISLQLDVVEALENNAYYAERNIVQETEGFINALDRLPPLIADFSKMIYIHISPIPAWFYMGFRRVAINNNIMLFPRLITVIYNFIVLGGVIYGIKHYKSFHFTSKQTLLFLAALLYLLLQTSSTEQRRIMICYPIVFFFFVLVYQSVSNSWRIRIIRYSVLLFMAVQFIGILKML